eukprot:1190854-Prorocentrum_minimum.AAC.4
MWVRGLHSADSRKAGGGEGAGQQGAGPGGGGGAPGNAPGPRGGEGGARGTAPPRERRAQAAYAELWVRPRHTHAPHPAHLRAIHSIPERHTQHT